MKHTHTRLSRALYFIGTWKCGKGAQRCDEMLNLCMNECMHTCNVHMELSDTMKYSICIRMTILNLYTNASMHTCNVQYSAQWCNEILHLYMNKHTQPVYEWMPAYIQCSFSAQRYDEILNLYMNENAQSVYETAQSVYAMRWNTQSIYEWMNAHMQRSYVWYEWSWYLTWLIYMCDMTHLYVWHDSSICVTCLVSTCMHAYTDWESRKNP